MLIVALRWQMCSEGKIEAALVADHLERCYDDTDESEDEDNIVYENEIVGLQRDSSEESDDPDDDESHNR